MRKWPISVKKYEKDERARKRENERERGREGEKGRNK
jgi:hypothetical protein